MHSEGCQDSSLPQFAVFFGRVFKMSILFHILDSICIDHFLLFWKIIAHASCTLFIVPLASPPESSLIPTASLGAQWSMLCILTHAHSHVLFPIGRQCTQCTVYIVQIIVVHMYDIKRCSYSRACRAGRVHWLIIQSHFLSSWPGTSHQPAKVDWGGSQWNMYI